jgi:hypothetical protein
MRSATSLSFTDSRARGGYCVFGRLTYERVNEGRGAHGAVRARAAGGACVAQHPSLEWLQQTNRLAVFADGHEQHDEQAEVEKRDHVEGHERRAALDCRRANGSGKSSRSVRALEGRAREDSGRTRAALSVAKRRVRFRTRETTDAAE